VVIPSQLSHPNDLTLKGKNMLEIFVLVLFLLALFATLIVLPLLLVIKATQLLFERPLNKVVSAVDDVREHNWRNASGSERLVSAGALLTGASVTVSRRCVRAPIKSCTGFVAAK
jgi:hypothetical protein